MSPYRSVFIDEILEVDEWEHTVELPTGTRKKMTLTHPLTQENFIFKFPKPAQAHQIWSELIASFIAGDLLRWNVQHTSIGKHRSECGGPIEYGNLLRYIYRRSASSPLESRESNADEEDFVEGWTHCVAVDSDYDRGKGYRHTLPLLLRIYDERLSTEADSYHLSIARQEYMDFWAQAFAFDTLISNTD